MDLTQLLQFVQHRGPALQSISTALPYLKTIGATVQGSRAGVLSPVDLSRYSGAGWEKCLKEAATRLVYRNDGMKYLGKSTENLDPVPGSGIKGCASFNAIITTTKQDRDGDILHPAGAEVDNSAPLLWQHDPMSPIGKLCKLVSQDKDSVVGAFAIADTPLGRDAAYLTEFGALRISHGFRPKEFNPIKSGQDIVGFEVKQYEIMEVSLVSVPSNTDAVITAFAKGLLKSPMMKSFGRTLYRNRPVVVVGGFNGMKAKLEGIKKAKCASKTGKTALKVKASQDFEEGLAAAASTIICSSDYGYCFYQQPDAAKEEYAVCWVMGDADSQGQTPDGTAYSTAEEIQQILSNVPGVTAVDMKNEETPPKGEGWRMVWPDAKDWVEENDANAGGAATDNQAPPSQDDPAQNRHTGTANKGQKGDAVEGSYEAVATALGQQLAAHLAQSGVVMDPNDSAAIIATFADSVVVAVGNDRKEDGVMSYYQIAYTGGEKPVLSGAPIAVELSVVLASQNNGTNGAGASGGAGGGDANAQTPAPVADNNSAGDGKRAVWVWKALKGKLTRKDTGKLNEALDHFNEALGAGKMPTTIKTLVQRGTDLVGDVVKGSTASDGTDTEADALPNLSEDGKRAWSMVKKLLKEGKPYAMALALNQLSEQVLKEAQERELEALANS